MITSIQLFLNRISKGYVDAPRIDDVEDHTCKVMVISAHPLSDSLSSHLSNVVTKTLRERGCIVRHVDLYNMDGKGKQFQGQLTADERKKYVLPGYPEPAADVKDLVKELRQADKLVFVYPTWWFGMPAIMKGFIDRTFLPGVAFRLPHLEKDGDKKAVAGLIPGLDNIKKVGVVTTYGATKSIAFAMGDSGRNLVTRSLLPLFSPSCSVTWLGMYEMDTQTRDSVTSFVNHVERVFKEF